MSRIDDLSADNPLREVWAAIEALRNANPLQAAAVGRGGITVYGGGVITIENGGLSVTGYAEISGELRGDGTLIWTGPWAFTGEGEITGNVGLTGNLDVVDDGKITVGNIRIENGKIYVGEGAGQIVIDGATGKITAGNMTIDPSGNGGQIDFGGGRVINAGTGFLGLYDGERQVIFNSSGVTMVAGGRSLSVGDAGMRFAGAPTKTASETGLDPGSAYFDSSNYIYKVVAG